MTGLMKMPEEAHMREDRKSEYMRLTTHTGIYRNIAKATILM